MKEDFYTAKIKERNFLHFTLGMLPRFYNYLINEMIVKIARLRGAKIGKHSSIPLSLAIKSNNNLIVGEYSIVESNKIDLREKVIIKDKVIINKGVQIIRQSHDLKSSVFKTIGNSIVIEKYVWLTSNCCITPSCTRIEGKAVVAVAAVVVKNVDYNTIVGGNPAKFIKNRPNIPHNLMFDSFQGRDFINYSKARFLK
jgi:acetyltransferase-like isoleucine patch superfamily enzyme